MLKLFNGEDGFIFYHGYNKITQTWLLKTTQMHYFTVRRLEAQHGTRWLKSSCSFLKVLGVVSGGLVCSLIFPVF